ncbi:hypothetical protein [Campylobacter sp. RM12651]|uniref:hypothetical protein n=1 Tax=Campylobacter sp. RM12651 TaxID=1660079 RepID=UPI001EFBC951|nr:hypothetical protein [Campylobacter sp. RM12651]ULO03798.1 hypothetical protein AVBRAN_1344 [Campylobacter sp. RM12651]
MIYSNFSFDIKTNNEIYENEKEEYYIIYFLLNYSDTLREEINSLKYPLKFKKIKNVNFVGFTYENAELLNKLDLDTTNQGNYIISYTTKELQNKRNNRALLINLAYFVIDTIKKKYIDNKNNILILQDILKIEDADMKVSELSNFLSLPKKKILDSLGYTEDFLYQCRIKKVYSKKFLIALDLYIENILLKKQDTYKNSI